MYVVYRNCYPQADVNVNEEWDIEPFRTFAEAKRFAVEETEAKKDEGWKGHPLYLAKYYVEEI